MLVLFISAIFLDFFIVILLLTKKQKSLTDKLLALFIASIGMQLLGYYLKQAGYWEQYPHLTGITAPVVLFHGPFLYLYCLYSLRPDRALRRIDYLHFTPGVAAYLYMTRFFFYSAEEKRLIDSGEISDFDLFSQFLLIAILISGLSYSIASYRLTIKHRHVSEEYFSFSEGVSLRWLRYCILSIGMVFLTAAVVIFLRDSLDLRFPFDPEYIFYTIIIGFIFLVGYFGIKQEHLFINYPRTNSVMSDGRRPAAKYKHSGIDEEKADQLFESLLRLMEEEQPFLEPRLTLAELAGMLRVSANNLSQIINQKAKVNFYDFVNNYRVDHFIKSAGKNKRYNLLALALESGFNSKSSFNQIFRKHKGQTPSEFLSLQKTNID
jgi:AraC-like DNA-binding protein